MPPAPRGARHAARRLASHASAASLVLGGILAAAAAVALAQPGLGSSAHAVTMTVIKPQAVSLAIISGATLGLPTITDNAINTFAMPVQITTSWTLHPSTGSLRLIAYFSNPAQALTNGSAYLSSATIEGRVQTLPAAPSQPTTWQSFTQSASGGVGTNGASLWLMDLNINGTNRQASRTMDLELRLNLTGQPVTISGTYSGVITLRAVTM